MKATDTKEVEMSAEGTTGRISVVFTKKKCFCNLIILISVGIEGALQPKEV